MVVSETRSNNLKEHEHGAKEYASDEENDEKLRSNSEERKLRLSEAAVARTSTKLSLVQINIHNLTILRHLFFSHLMLTFDC